MKTTCVLKRAPPYRAKLDMKVPFMSTCPKCAQFRPQRGYDRNSLRRLLRGGHPVEAYCAMCDKFWSISAKEGAALVAAAVAGGGTVIC